MARALTRHRDFDDTYVGYSIAGARGITEDSSIARLTLLQLDYFIFLNSSN
jgi:hypothetical protein